ncbi:SAG family member [Eimeria brunetti]|uniref:SAG family member n=1 Tax=Eimeria brunetti TaxID=51314 RepID=U6LKG5_9EIME|nr:SAG family member [Eimeria brunetti]
MKGLGSVLLAAAVLGAARADNTNSGVTQNGSADTTVCLAEFNKARAQAALNPFIAEATAKKKMPINDPEYVKKGEAVSKSVADYARTGTYAYAPQTGSTADCAAAVSFWKEAHKNFQELPGEYKDDEEGLYADSKNRSLVALFNTNESATIDCAYFTCPLPTTSTSTSTAPTNTQPTTQPTTADPSPTGPSRVTSPLSERQPAASSASVESQGNELETAPSTSSASQEDKTREEQQAAPSVRRLSASEGTVSGLVCLTNPAALQVGKKPFSETVWANIKKAMENSAPSSTQSALLVSGLALLSSFIVF